MRILLISSLLAFVSFASSFAQDFRLPPTPVGKAVTAYVAAYNSGDTTKMKEFYAIYTAGDMGGPSVAQRLGMYRGLFDELGTIRLARLLERSGPRISLLVESQKSSFMKFSFMFGPGDPPTMMGMGIDRADPDEKPVERAASMSDFVSQLGTKMKELDRTGTFSGTLLVMKDGKSVFERAYGYADREKKVANTMETRFNLGSINKAFTALAVRQLIREGTLASDGLVGTYLPDYPNKEVRGKVTIDHLLSMTSGIGDIFGDRYDAMPKENLRSIKDYIPLFADVPLAFEPGTSRMYSNGGYLLLGLLIETVTGEDYYEYITRTIFEPAGMTETHWYERNADVRKVARGYTKEGGGVQRRNIDSLPEKGSSAGGGYSTVRDLVRYSEALADAKICHPDDPARQGFGIAGGAPGINAAFEWMPEEGVTIIVLSNVDPPSATGVSRLIRDMLPRN